MTGPLDGIRVLDLSRVLAGPLCTQVLADLGAEVWKVEHPDGDDTRRWGPPFVGEDAAYFLSANRGKRSIAVDLSVPAGAAVVADLAERADVLVENFRRGDLDRHGLGADVLRDRNPRLVHVAISGYGRTGPRADEPGYDLVMQAMTGLLHATGQPDGPMARVGVALLDVLTGQAAVIAVLAALREREQTGEGRHVDLSLFDVGLTSMVNVAQSALVTGVAPERHGTGHPSIVPYEAMHAQDGELVIAVGNDRQFRRLCEVLGLEGLADDERFATNPARVASRDDLLPLLAARLRDLPVADAVELLTDAGVPVAPVNDVADALDDPQTAARGLRWPTHHPAGDVDLLGSPFGELGSHARDGAPPLLAAHTRDLLHGVLGLDDASIDALVDAGAVAERDDGSATDG